MNAFVRGIAHTAAAAVTDTLSCQKYLFNLMTAFGGAFGKSIAQNIRIAVFPRTCRDNKYVFSSCYPPQMSFVMRNAATHKHDTTFCDGTSLLNPAKPFMDLWYKVNKSFPEYKLHLVPFEDNHEGILSEIEKLGEKFDFLIGVCDSKAWLSLCSFLPLGRYKKMIAVSREHPLAAKSRIDIEDLYGETLMMVKRGDSGVNDFIRNDLEKNHHQIHIEDNPHFYDLSVFNRCAETGNVLLAIECWQEVHPGLVSIPVNWDYSIPYGLLYSFHAPEDVLRFVKAAENITPKS